MKNNFKTYAKKSVSLFLAVLMVMSCWVWMAPEEKLTASAGSHELKTKYDVKLTFMSRNSSTVNFKNNAGGIWYKYANDSGYGSTVTQKWVKTNFNDYRANGEFIHELEFTAEGFPISVALATKGGAGASWLGIDPARVEVREIVINGRTVYQGFDGHNGQLNKDVTTEVSGWAKPAIMGFLDSSATAPDINIELPQVGGQDIQKGTTYNLNSYELYDQYFVKASDYLKNNNKYCTIKSTTTHVSSTKNSGEAVSGEIAADIYATANDKDTVVVKPNLQISDPKGSTGAATYYLVRTYVYDTGFGEETSKVSAQINITYPKYTVNFNGGLSSAKIFADAEYTGSYSPSNYNGGTIAVPSKAEAAGYTFYGFWSKRQPETGNASYNAAKADFAAPCSSENYASYKAAAGSTENNGIVTDADGNKWYDAGKALVPAEVNKIDVSENKANFVENWYAYWLAKDLSVKFYDVDGAFLGEKLVKSGQTQADITWPTSKYINSGYTTGAFKFKVDANIWETTAGKEINKNSYTFTEDLILTPKLTRTEFKDKYTITFMNPNGGSVAVGTDGKYDYRADIKSYADTAKDKVAGLGTPNSITSDENLEFRYELLGWSSVEPTTGKNYHVLLEDADFDVNGTAIGLNSDWVVRGDETYYPVYRRITKTYVVEFHYKDATGADATRQLKFKYGSTLVPPTEYVPYSYVTKGFGYTFNKWAYSNADGDATLDYNATIPFTNEYISIEGAALDGTADLDPIDITATYGDRVATPYTVTFNYINSKGEENSSNVQVKNEQFILQDTVDTLKPAEKWENENQLYTYADKWEITEGAAVNKNGVEKKVGDIINTADLITLSPTSNVTFKAVYANPIPYFTVTYVDGAKTFKDRVLQGSNVPEWTEKVNNDNGTPDDTTDDFEEDKIYVPADYEGEGGTYEFQGWFDAVTGGNKYTTADFVTSDLTLYSQFKFVPDTFTITFMNHDGSVQLAAGKYEKGQNIEAIVTTATKAAQGRAKDNTYEYLFLGWDKAVPTFCEGYNVTYTALYKPVYRYYDVKWYNSKLVDGKWVADKTTTGEGEAAVEKYLLATTHHTYNSKLYTPSVSDLNCLEDAPAGQVYTFAGWYYNDAEGNAVKFERGMVVTAEMEFYATYTLSDKVYTVTTVVKGETTKYVVADGKTAEIPDPQAGYVDATKHDAFAGWYTNEECTTEFDDDAKINADITLYAKFTESTHDFSEEELVSAPTYYDEGEMDVWCACDKAKTKKTEPIDMLTDKEIPTGTIYLGGLGSWSSTDEIGGAALDNGVIDIYANANTDVIVTANDTGDVNALYNPSGLGKGIEVIRAFIYPGKFKTLTADSYGAAQSLTVDVYNDYTEALTNNANFSVKLGDFVVADLDEDGKPQYDENGKVKFKNLVSGESYIVYYYVVDKAGNQLRQKVRTAKFIYDDTKPVFTVEGENNDAALPTFCGTATVTGVEADAVLTVNGETVTVVDGKYVINYAEGMDTVTITATDKAGNTFTKKIKVADHSYITTEQAASCGVAGYKKVECIICGDVKSAETYDALDHIWSDRQVIPADCVNNGIVVVSCSICGDEVRTEFEEDGVTPVIPALGHEYAKDAEGNIIYTTVTEATCKTKGLAEAICTVCGDGRITKALDLDPANHEDITITNVEADCVNGGYYTEACSCGVTIKSETYPATGHGTIDEGTAEWYVRTEPTCYQTGEKVLKCLVCSNFVEVDGEEVTAEIEATGEHVKTVTNPDTYKADGFVYYHCATEGCDFKYEPKQYIDDSLKEYTVTFKAENGTVIKSFKQLEGSAIAKDAVTAPDKANSEDCKYKYTFAGWKDKDGKIYKLPLTVTGDLVLTASYKETKIMYTHTFKVQNTWVESLAAEKNTYVTYATLVGAMNDERVPSSTPVFKHKDEATDAALKKLYTFEFKGWKNAKGELVTDFTVAGDAEFTAYFEAVPVTYDVIFYNGAEVIWTDNINGGESAAYENYVLGADGKPVVDEEGNKTLIVPEKAYDKTNHYAFSNKWYTDSGCTKEYNGAPITEKTRLYAGYTETVHSLVIDTTKGKNGIIQQANCLLPEITAKKCSDEACGYTCEVPTAVALGHNDKVKLEDGTEVINGGNETINDVVYYVVRCSRCGEILDQDKVSSTVKFVNWNDAILGRETYETGKEILMPDLAPERVADDKNTYTFIGWSYKVGETTVFISKDAANLGTANADITFVATYEASTRYYKVTYVDLDNNTLYNHYTEVNGEKIMGVPYGTALPAYAGATAPATLKGPKYVEAGHYVFDKWQYDESYIVKGDVVVAPEFKLEAHDKKTAYTDATCTAMGGQTITCTKCEYKATVNATEPALGHAWNDGVVTTAPDYQTQTPGVMTYTCTRCGETYTKEIAGNSYSIKATVKDANGNPSANVRVELLKKNEAGVYDLHMAKNTGADGVVIFAPLTKGDYRVVVTSTNTHYDATVKEDGTVSGGDITAQPENKPVDNSCKCSCHKDNFWGIIYRLIQKIIKFFTGKPSCCACPDNRI